MFAQTAHTFSHDKETSIDMRHHLTSQPLDAFTVWREIGTHAKAEWTRRSQFLRRLSISIAVTHSNGYQRIRRTPMALTKRIRIPFIQDENAIGITTSITIIGPHTTNHDSTEG